MKFYLILASCLSLFLVVSCSKEETADEPQPLATCVDGIQNGDETGTDCGGSCDPCGVNISGWNSDDGFPGSGRWGTIGFMRDNEVFVGFGYNNKKDFYRYNVNNGNWVQLDDFPGQGRDQGFGFSIGNKAYVGGGSCSGLCRDLWEYDLQEGAWTERAAYPEGNVAGTTGLAINGKGYAFSIYLDFWEYDPVEDIWTRKGDILDLPMTLQPTDVGFTVQNKGYFGVGPAGQFKELWEYDPQTNDWEKKADFPGTEREGAFSFAVKGKGYVAMGYDYYDYKFVNDLWEYDPTADTWTELPSPFSYGMSYGTSCSNGEVAFLGFGKREAQGDADVVYIFKP